MAGLDELVDVPALETLRVPLQPLDAWIAHELDARAFEAICVGVGSRLQVLRFEPPLDVHLVLTHAAQLSRLKRLELRLSEAGLREPETRSV